jgi:DNA adenine methylase
VSQQNLESKQLASSTKAPAPFLRWAGGKRKLAELIVQSFPTTFNFGHDRFFEPFVGGGALSIYLGNENLSTFIPGSNLYINDLNPDLIATYISIRDDLDGLVRKLEILSKDVSKSAFEKVRAARPTEKNDIAARFIYLNKTCFNGLWRVNGKGEFNVPWGQLKNPLIFDIENLKLVSKRLQQSTITNSSFVSALKNVQKGDVVYFDPPYIPLNVTSSFSKYAKEDFGILDQYALAGVIDGLTASGVHVILSNSDTPLTRKIFGESLNLHQISVNRNIAAKSSSRVPVNEIIGVNFKLKNSSNLKLLKVVS